MTNPRPIPAALRAAGITGARHNMPAGQVVQLPHEVVMLFFGEALQQRFVKGGRRANTTGNT